MSTKLQQSIQTTIARCKLQLHSLTHKHYSYYRSGSGSGTRSGCLVQQVQGVHNINPQKVAIRRRKLLVVIQQQQRFTRRWIRIASHVTY